MSLAPTETLMTDRAAKGALYAAAVNAFWTAWIELFACDMALGIDDMRIGTWPLAESMMHSDFISTHTALNGNWSAAAAARAGEIISDGFIIEPEG